MVIGPLNRRLHVLNLIISTTRRHMFSASTTLKNRPVVIHNVRRLHNIRALIRQRRLIARFITKNVRKGNRARKGTFNDRLLSTKSRTRHKCNSITHKGTRTFKERNKGLSCNKRRKIMITRQLTRTRRRSITRTTLSPNRFTITRRLNNRARLFSCFANKRIANRTGLTNNTRQTTRTTTSLQKSTRHNTNQMSRGRQFSRKTIRRLPRNLSNNTFIHRLTNRLNSRLQRGHNNNLTTLNYQGVDRFNNVRVRVTGMVINRLLSSRLQRSRFNHFLSTLLKHRVRGIRQQLAATNVILK